MLEFCVNTLRDLLILPANFIGVWLLYILILYKCDLCQTICEWIKRLWYIYTMEYYLAIKRNTFESVPVRWMNLEPIIQSEVSQKEKNKYCILMQIYAI